MKNKIIDISKKILPFAIIPFILTGCAKKSDCELKDRHVHKYTSKNKYGIITTYINSEDIEYGGNGFDWNKDYITTTFDDEKFYKVKKDLFDGIENWEYIYNFMSTRSDYLQFYYSYDTEEDYWDGEGNHHTRTVNHSGWTDNPIHQGVTGDVRLYHHRFFGYKIIYENGEYVKYKSPLVDDIRKVIFDYPYCTKDCSELVYSSYKYNIYDLPFIKLSDFEGVFTSPDLSTSELYSKNK